MKKHAIDIQIRPGIKLPFKKSFLKMIIEETLGFEKIIDPCELSLVVTNDKEIRELNHKYRNIDKPTDVLSFSLTEAVIGNGIYGFNETDNERKNLGEIIVSYERVVEQARDYDKTISEELMLLIVHGVLHLLGYDHESEKPARLMEKKERLIIKAIKENSM